MAIILALVFWLGGQTPGAWASEFGLHPGYLADTTHERHDVATEVVILPPPQDPGLSLRDRIFAEKVTKEFQLRYEERFGQTRAEQLIAIPSRFFETEVQPGQYRTAQEESEEQKAFGSFMAKRLIEFHVDRYLKENPSARPVYELKERVSNLDMEVKPGYKARLKYSLSNNDLSLELTNPFNIRNRVSMQSEGTLVLLGYPIAKSTQILTSFMVEKDEYSLSGVRQLDSNWSTSLTGSKTEIEGEKLILGLTWRD